MKSCRRRFEEEMTRNARLSDQHDHHHEGDYLQEQRNSSLRTRSRSWSYSRECWSTVYFRHQVSNQTDESRSHLQVSRYDFSEDSEEDKQGHSSRFTDIITHSARKSRDTRQNDDSSTSTQRELRDSHLHERRSQYSQQIQTLNQDLREQSQNTRENLRRTHAFCQTQEHESE